MTRAPQLREFAAISELTELFRARHRLVEVGIGDDAAVLKPFGRSVWTVDTAVEHVHFERRWLSLADLGWRSFNAAASDVCAMGGAPVAALSNVIFPEGFSAAELSLLARGQRAAARALGCEVVGGNLSRGSELSITTTVLGRVTRPLLRSGARVGDELWLCGELGLAAAGLALLQRGDRSQSAAARRALRAFRRPRAELAAGLALAARAHAAIDISDGLAGDAAHLAEASGVRVMFDCAAPAPCCAPRDPRAGARSPGRRRLCTPGDGAAPSPPESGTGGGFGGLRAGRVADGSGPSSPRRPRFSPLERLSP